MRVKVRRISCGQPPTELGWLGRALGRELAALAWAVGRGIMRIGLLLGLLAVALGARAVAAARRRRGVRWGARP